ncbi:MAG: glycosyltransferase [Thermoguttaceae bacterium]|nr:glycosyltransferase [Thermoguttaceae bacterium]
MKAIASAPVQNSVSETPITICQLLHSLNVGGAEILASRLARRLSGKKWRFVFFCLDASGVQADEMRAAGFPVEVLGRKPGFDRNCMKQLAQLWEKYQVRFVQAHQYTPFFYALGARGFTQKNPPILFTEHGRFFPDFPNFKHKIFNRIFMRSTDRITAVSQSVANAVIQNEGIPAARVEVIRNGIDEIRFTQNRMSEPQKTALRTSLGLTNERIILFTARLDPIKDHPTAIQAMKYLLNFPSIQTSDETPVLLLAGDGPERKTIESCVQENHLENRIRLLGERTDISELLQISDIFLLTSKSEGIPLTILEAFASGVPVVATDVGGIPEVINTEKNGLLAASGDFRQIALHLEKILKNPDTAAQITENARIRFEDEFTETQMLAQYEKIFEEICR